MKKIISFCVILILALLTFIVFKPETLPAKAQQPFWKLHHQLNLSEIQAIKKDNKMYKRTAQDGTTIFSDTQRDGATVHHVDKSKSAFIDMKSAQQSSQPDTPNTSIDAVLDPVNSINNEAAKNVQKIQEARNQQLAEQGI